MPVVCIDCQLPYDACECDDDPRYKVIVTPEDRETNEELKKRFTGFAKAPVITSKRSPDNDD